MSETIKEIASVLKDALITPVQEAFVYRARNPFFGTLVIAWLFYNWNKIAYFILSKDEVLEKIKFIRHEFDSSFTHSFAYPFIWAVFVSLTYPFFTYASIWIHKWITGHIEKINSTKEISRIGLQEELITAIHRNESKKTELQAETDLNIEEKKEKAARSRLNVELLKEQKSTLESEIESLSVQKQSAQSTLSAVSLELESANKRVDEISDEFEKVANKYGDLEDLRKKYEERGQHLHETSNKLRKAEEAIDVLNATHNEELKKNNKTEEELVSEISSLKEKLNNTTNNYNEVNGKLNGYYTRERFSARARSDAIYNYRNIIEGIITDLSSNINSQKQLNKDLDRLEDIAVGFFNDASHPLVAGTYSTNRLSQGIYQGLEGVKTKISKLIEQPKPYTDTISYEEDKK